MIADDVRRRGLDRTEIKANPRAQIGGMELVLAEQQGDSFSKKAIIWLRLRRRRVTVSPDPSMPWT